jgi:hypothetical protein
VGTEYPWRLAFAVLVMVADLAVGCAAPAKPVRPSVWEVGPGPNAPELARLMAAFRTQDRELGDRLAGDGRIGCYQLRPFEEELARLMGKLCEFTSTQEEGRYTHSGSCRYIMERSARLNREARRRSCERHDRFFDTGMSNR